MAPLAMTLSQICDEVGLHKVSQLARPNLGANLQRGWIARNQQFVKRHTNASKRWEEKSPGGLSEGEPSDSRGAQGLTRSNRPGEANRSPIPLGQAKPVVQPAQILACSITRIIHRWMPSRSSPGRAGFRRTRLEERQARSGDADSSPAPDGPEHHLTGAHWPMLYLHHKA